MSIHAAIKARRERLGWSQQKLADEVARREGKPLRWQSVQQWENGTSAPARRRLEHVAAALSTTPAKLLAGDETDAPVQPVAQSRELSAKVGKLTSLLIQLQQLDPTLFEQLSDHVEKVVQVLRANQSLLLHHQQHHVATDRQPLDEDVEKPTGSSDPRNEGEYHGLVSGGLSGLHEATEKTHRRRT
jgi:transcriptional regulator with XRE-family HTH domain